MCLCAFYYIEQRSFRFGHSLREHRNLICLKSRHFLRNSEIMGKFFFLFKKCELKFLKLNGFVLPLFYLYSALRFNFMVKFIFKYVGKSVKKIVPKKIVRYMRDVVMIADDEGNIAKYVLAKDTTPQKRTTRKLTTRKPIPRPNLTKTKKPISMADEAAKKNETMRGKSPIYDTSPPRKNPSISQTAISVEGGQGKDVELIM